MDVERQELTLDPGGGIVRRERTVTYSAYFLLLLFSIFGSRLANAEIQIISGPDFDETQEDRSAEFESVIDRNLKYEPLVNYSKISSLKRLSKPVGMLNVTTDLGYEFTCTATLISRDKIITANHCVGDSVKTGAVKEVELLMGYYASNDTADSNRYRVKFPPIEASENLDYAILAVQGNPTKKWGYARVQSFKPGPSEPLLIVHHPLGMPKHITRGGCLSSTPPVVDGTLQHKCATLKGSSGAPIFTLGNEAIVAVHTRGVNRNRPERNNYAMLMYTILEKGSVKKGSFGDVADNEARVLIPPTKLSDSFPTKEAMGYLVDDCSLNDQKSCGMLGIVYSEGFGVAKKDVGKALDLLSDSCEAKIGLSCAILGKMYAQGDDVDKDLGRMIRLMEQACDYGQYEGCAAVGGAYLNGWGVSADSQVAKSYFRKACDHGVVMACQLLSSIER